jgi:copper transport protein
MRAWLLLLAAGTVHAHAHLQQSSPADGGVLARAPAQLVLTFSEGARLVTLAIAADQGAPRKLAPLPQKAQSTITVTLPKLEPGRYVVTWRVLGTDGHVVPGSLRFTITQ